jgi:phosphoglycolate phosphatase-like HAD superfamily hydrolase
MPMRLAHANSGAITMPHEGIGSTSAAASARARLWLFDFDNTLAALEREVDWAASRRELEAFLRAEGVGDAIFVEFPKGNLVLYEALRGRLPGASADRDSIGIGVRGDTAALLRRASTIIEAYELRGAERAAPIAGAEALLKALRTRDKAVAIVTSNSSRTVKRWLERNKMDAYVSTIVGRDTLLPLKPANAMVMRALELHTAGPGDAVFVGDSEADLGAARSSKVGFYGIAPNQGTKDRLIAAGVEQVYASPAALAMALGWAHPAREDGGG